MTAVRKTTRRGVSYRRRGTGRAVVLLHGWCLDGSLWTYEEDLLAADHEVLTPDLPGFGRSEGVAGPYSMADHADALLELLDEADVRDAVLVGFAFGADVALTAATRDDSRLAGLVLAGTTSGAQFPADKMVRSMRRDWPDFARRSAHALCPPPHSDATRDWLERIFSGSALHVGIQVAEALGEFEPLPLCAELGLPALFVHGADDAVSTVDVARACSEAAPHSQLAVLEDCRHLLVLDQRQPFHEAVASFMVGLSAPERRNS
ncbi:alpha/beta fold hydrolase [Pseudonocardia sichuanensis]